MIEKKILVVASGGLDSTVALIKCHKEYSHVEALTFSYGANHNQVEHEALKKTCAKYGINLTTIDLSFMGKHFTSSLLGGEIPEGNYNEENMKSTVVPFRNGIMLSVAAGYAESKEFDAVVLGNHSGDHTIYPDCRADFIQAMSQAIKLGTWKNVEVISPFCNVSKADIVKIGTELGVDFALTYSCYKGGQKHCGKCGTCRERIEAFQIAGVKDPTQYMEYTENTEAT